MAGLGLGFSFGSIFDAARSGIDQAAAGSASGALSAVQHLANCSGSAAITTVFFQALHAGDYAHAVTASLGAVIGIAAASSALVWTLPSRLRALQNPASAATLPQQGLSGSVGRAPGAPDPQTHAGESCAAALPHQG